MRSFQLTRVPSFYQNYVKLTGEEELIPLLKQSKEVLLRLCVGLTESQVVYRYEEGKWSIKDLIQHLSDSERVFAYRAMRFARNDQQELPGFEQDDYVAQANADTQTLYRLLEEFSNIRTSTINLYSSLDEEKLIKKGISNKNEMSVEMIGYIISGHTLHHAKIIEERYLK